MFEMRAATVADVPAVAEMIRARCGWMEDQGMPSWRASVEGLAEQAGDGDMWLLVEDGHRVVGCTTVQDGTPPWGWTPDELAEPAHYLYTSATDPTYRTLRPGTVMALWAVDRAARMGKGWVRRGCLFPALVRYYETQGFTLFHREQRTHNLVYLMGRRAEPVPELGTLLARSLARRRWAMSPALQARR